MGYFVNRTIEEFDDGLNTTYFLHGDQPLPKFLFDDIEQCLYCRFGSNFLGEKMYFRVDFDKK